MPRGIIVGVMTLTGLALRLAGLIVDLAGGSLAAAVLSAAVVVLLGLAVPVTASFIISFVVISPRCSRSASSRSPRRCSSSTTRC